VGAVDRDYDHGVSGRLEKLLGTLVLVTLLMQAVAGRAGAVCVGPDHLGLSGERDHPCCDHSEDVALAKPALIINIDDRCECIDLGLPSDPLQVKRPESCGDADAPRRCMATSTMVVLRSERPPTLRRATDRRHLRTIVLLI